MPKPTTRSTNGRTPGRRQARLRQQLLAELSTAQGVAWATSRRAEVHQEGRPAAGGFPGTLTEARALFAQFIVPHLARLGSAEPSYGEQESGARAIYRCARNEWLKQRDAEVP